MTDIPYQQPYLPLPRADRGAAPQDIRIDYAQCEKRFFSALIGNHEPDRQNITTEGLVRARTMAPLFSSFCVYAPEGLKPALDSSKEAPQKTGRWGRPTRPAPHAMLLSSADDLETHLLFAYQVALAHYVLGKEHRIKGSFPDLCCGISASNVTLSLIASGYTNAVAAGNTTYDHWYTLLPFVLREERIEGCILVDPTAEQTFRGRFPRVAATVRVGKRWEYRTDWAAGADLYPEVVRLLAGAKPFTVPAIMRGGKAERGGNDKSKRLSVASGPGTTPDKQEPVWSKKRNVRRYFREAFSTHVPPPDVLDPCSGNPGAHGEKAYSLPLPA